MLDAKLNGYPKGEGKIGDIFINYGIIHYSGGYKYLAKGIT